MKENQVISIETRRKDEKREFNIYVLAQMINKTDLIIFNAFNSDNNWQKIDLEKPLFFFVLQLRSNFPKNSNIFRQGIKGLTNYNIPKQKIKPLGIGSRYVIIWKGTPSERQILILGQGGGKLIEEDMSSGKYIEKILIPSIEKKDLDIINKFELTGARTYAEFNERLYLCYKMKKNIDPMKELIFDLPIPLEYKEYINIISS